MMNSTTTRLFLAAGLTLALASTLLTGCEKPPPPPPPKVVAPPPPPAPDPVVLQPLLTQAKPDARVQFPQERAPVDESLAKAVIGFADAFAKAEAAKLGSAMDPLTKQVLDQLSGNGSLDEEMKKAEAVRVVYLNETAVEGNVATAAQLVIAIQNPGNSYVLGWGVAKVSDAWVFTATPTTSNMRARASEWDGADISAFAPTATASVSTSELAPANAEARPKEAETKEAEKKPDDGSKTVRTPNGPIKVPGGG